ncbi:MAG TPA: carboxypeptidase regulatory-like domain-containing protein, partial [Pyrinomonadaceae bacterium]|nr:carboxypeptidase regulatory-like domain-containing protein [Pyrinomonadaceae bacterium]
TYSISGAVTDAGTNPVAGVTLTLAGTGSSLTEATTTTNASGAYTFTGLPAGGNYTVTPSKQDYSFNPASRSYNALSANQTAQNYTAAVAYTISGTVSGGSGPIAGATVTLSGAGTGTRTTDANGFYSFQSLLPGGTYTVTPSLADHTFDPLSRTFGNLSASQTANFNGISTAATDLAITTTASAQSVPANEEVTYTLLVTNGGANAAANVVVTDNLPQTLTFVSCAASAGGTCVGGNAAGNNRTVTFPSLAPGASAVATIVARVNSNVAENTNVSNTAQVSSANNDPAPANNTSSAAFTVRPEPAFDEDGRATTDFGGAGQGAAVALQTDGRIVVGGNAVRNGNRDFALSRYNEDGSPDSTFGTSGRVLTDFFAGHDLLHAVAVQADGRIVAAGQAFNTADKDFAVARYNADGSLDLSFGSNGLVNTDFSSSEDAANAVAIQADGKIVLAGSAGNDFALARYNADGTPDTSFDGDGLLTLDFDSGADVARALVIQPDGRIVAAGTAADSAGKDFAVARFNEDGTPDASFDSDGKAVVDFTSAGDEAFGLALQSDGRLVLAGMTYSAATGNKDFALARLNSDGSLDLSFSTDGLATTDFEPDADAAYGVAVQKDGRIVAAGFSRLGNSNYDFAAARYLPNGQLDTSFDADGKQTVPFAGDDRAYSVAVQKNGRIVAAGATTLADGSRDFAVARLRANGHLDSDGDTEETANLSVAGTASANPAVVGEGFIYTFVVTNNGAGDATGVQLTGALPAGVQFVSANATQGAATVASGQLTANLGGLLRGASATVNVQVTAAAAGLLPMTATASAPETDPNPANNSATVNVRAVRLSAIKLMPSTVVKGGGCEVVTGSVHISGGVAGQGGVVVALASANPAASVPATVTIPKGASSATFTVTTSRVNSNQSGAITAELGPTTLSRGLTVTPGCP